MKEALAAAFRSPAVRAVASYPFRLGPAGTKWTSTRFGGLAIVNNLSSAGDAMVTVALAGSVFVSVSLSAARGRTALGLIITVLPFALVGPFVGPAIDRVRGGRKFIVFLSAIGRMAAALMMAAWIHSLLLFPAAFLSLVCSKTHTVAKASLVPEVVDDEADLVRANSRLAVGSAIVTSIAALIGAAIYKIFDSHVLLDFDVLIFSGVAALSLYLLSGSREPAAPLEPNKGIAEGESPPKRKRGLIGGVAAAIRPGPRPVVARDVILAQIAMAGMRAVAGFMAALVVFAFRKQGAPVIWYGLVAVASVGGMFAGALSAPWLRSRFSERTLMASAASMIALTAVGVTQLGGLHRRPAALILAFVVGLGASVAKAAFDAIVQAETMDVDRSRLFARFESIFQLAWVVGALIPVLINTPLLAGYVIVAITVIACSASFVLGVARGGTGPRVVRTPVPDPAPSAPAEPAWDGEASSSPPGQSWGSVPEPYPNPGPPPAVSGPG
jgi:MFS family permease